MAHSSPSSHQRKAKRKQDSTEQSVDFLNHLAAIGKSSPISEHTNELHPRSPEGNSGHGRELSNRLPNTPNNQDAAATLWRSRFRGRLAHSKSSARDIFSDFSSPEVRRSPRLKRKSRVSYNLPGDIVYDQTINGSRNRDNDDALFIKKSSENQSPTEDSSDSDQGGRSDRAALQALPYARESVLETPIKAGSSRSINMNELPKPEVVIINRKALVGPIAESLTLSLLTSPRNGNSAKGHKRTRQEKGSSEENGAISSSSSVHLSWSPTHQGLLTEEEEPPPPPSSDSHRTAYHAENPALQQQDSDGINEPQIINGQAQEGLEARDADEGPREVEIAESRSSEDPVFEKASRVLQQRENWVDLVKTAETIAKDAGLWESVRFRGIDDLKEHIATLCTLYNKIQQQRSAGEVEVGLLHDSTEWVKTVSNKAFHILAKAQRKAASGKTAIEQLHCKGDAHRLVSEYETDVIPRLVTAAQACLKAHYVSPTLANEGYSAVHGILQIIFSTSQRIFTLKQNGVITGHDRGRALRPTLRSLLKAMERGEFERRLQVWADRASHPPTTGVEAINLESDSDEQEEEWTEDESLAILDGLQMFQGLDRYQQLIRHFGGRLRTRTMADVQAKARELRDSYLEAIGDGVELRTVRGQQQWAWLLSI